MGRAYSPYYPRVAVNLGRWPRLAWGAPLARDCESAQDGGMWFGWQDSVGVQIQQSRGPGAVKLCVSVSPWLLPSMVIGNMAGR